MPELAEVKIMSDFVNDKSKNVRFIQAWHVEKGNNPKPFDYQHKFNIQSDTNGKELVLNLYNRVGEELPIHVFMGMNGNWKWVETENWNETKYVRMKFDSECGNSLLLYGGFMGPKYSVGKPFKGTKRGPDPTKNFDEFKSNVLNNLTKKDFDKPIYEVLLNQKYFNGIGNYLRSTILYYLDINPFQTGKQVIKDNPEILEMCRDIPLRAYQLNGGQLKDWKNPYDSDYEEFKEWVYYQKGNSLKDSNNRTFWYQPKWESFKD